MEDSDAAAELNLSDLSVEGLYNIAIERRQLEADAVGYKGWTPGTNQFSFPGTTQFFCGTELIPTSPLRKLAAK
jgi:hypothetical protein